MMVDFNRAVEFLAEKCHYHLGPQNAPKMTQMEQAKASVKAMQLPVESSLQPESLIACQNDAGDFAEDESHEVYFDEDTGKQVARPLRAKPSKGPKTAWQVARGHLLYWHMILALQHLIEEIPAGYVVREPGVFLHPYFVGQLQQQLAPLVGGGSVTGPGLDNVLRPLLREAQERVNHRFSSGDEALTYILQELPKRMATLAATKSDHEARMKAGGPSRERPDGDAGKSRKKPKKELADGSNKRALPAQTKCKTCAGNAGHVSGRCWKCRSRDAPQPAPAGPGAAQAPAQGE